MIQKQLHHVAPPEVICRTKRIILLHCCYGKINFNFNDRAPDNRKMQTCWHSLPSCIKNVSSIHLVHIIVCGFAQCIAWSINNQWCRMRLVNGAGWYNLLPWGWLMEWSTRSLSGTAQPHQAFTWWGHLNATSRYPVGLFGKRPIPLQKQVGKPQAKASFSVLVYRWRCDCHGLQSPTAYSPHHPTRWIPRWMKSCHTGFLWWASPFSFLAMKRLQLF